MTLAVEMVDITKRFARVVANDHACLAVHPGTIHALVGENGAGKTTLMNILFGHYRPDSGRVLVEGRPVRWTGPADAMAAGIGMVHQEFTLVPPLTVAENVVLGAEPQSAGVFLDRPGARRAVKELAHEAGFTLDPDLPVTSLPIGLRQRVEILKALWHRARVLILDEPTSALSPPETEELFSLLRSIRDRGTTIVLITHRVPEVLALADRVTVMRRGRTVAEEKVAGLTAGELVSLMVPPGETPPRPPTDVSSGVGRAGESTEAPMPPLIELRGITVEGAAGESGLRNITLSLPGGRILGLASVEGNGALELAELLAGLRKPREGEIRWRGEPVAGFSPADARRRGIAYLPGDRERHGLFPSLSLAENILVGRRDEERFCRRGWLNLARIGSETAHIASRWGIVPHEPTARLEEFSGGNQQRVLVARELARRPQLVVAVHPTRGLDWAGRKSVHRALGEEKERGAAVLLISADLEEILSLSDRVMVLYRGEIAGVWPAAEATQQKLGRALTGA